MSGIELIQWACDEISKKGEIPNDARIMGFIRELIDIPAVDPRRAKREISCTICGDPTEWCCADCAIDKRQSIRVCKKPECRDQHEQRGQCSRKGI